MAEQLQVAIWQHASSLDAGKNRAELADRFGSERLENPAGTPTLIVLPEASARDFGNPGSDLAPYAEPLDGPYVAALRAIALHQEATVVAGIFEVADDPARPYNTLVLTDGDRITTYRKIHLYDSFGQRESDLVSPGPLTPVVAEVGALKTGLMTCYDLRFPELGRALSSFGAEVIVLPAAWVAGPGKVDQWRTLVRARAIENVCWVVAAAQPGPRYCGHSMVVAPSGDVVAEAGEDEELLLATITLDAVREARERNPSLANRRL